MPSTAPAIPPRPSRSPRPGSSTPSSDAPKVPPRPSNRRHERSTSPGQGSFAPSPLNEIPSAPRTQPQNESGSSLPGGPLSVTLPSGGQGGNEYEHLDPRTTLDSQAQVQDTPIEQKRDIRSDLKLHAPMPSLPSSTAKAKVHAVTHTSSQQAAAAGLGTASPSIEQQDLDTQLQSETNGSQNASTSPSIERQTSGQLGGEQGIPEIGQQVPMYPNAGDVQAPSVPPLSSRPTSLTQPNDKYERDWQENHPEELAREEQAHWYQPDRAESALSSAELNRIVRDSASRGAGVGTSSAAVATPEEELGYIASEEFTSRLTSASVVESPLRKPNSPTGQTPVNEVEELEEPSKALNEGTLTQEEENVIHIEEPFHHQHHPDGFAPGKEDESRPGVRAGSRSGGGRENEEDVPVLASDERDSDAEHMQPAISPTFEGKDGRDLGEEEVSRDTSSGRSDSAAAISLPSRGVSNARGEEDEETKSPSADVEEYEPLSFKEGMKENEPFSTADEFKQRPEHVNRRFPSKDTWEEPPNSSELHATVTTPDVSGHPRAEVPSSPDKSLDKEVVRKETAQVEDREERSPSKDAQDDASESQLPVATGPELEGTETSAETVPSKPAIPPRPTIPPIPSRPPKRVLKAPPFDANIRPPSESNVTKSTQPATSPTESRKAPVLPERPKPQIPARPGKPVGRGSSESLTKVNSGSSAESGEAPKKPPLKPKPAVPARPGGSKIAALKAGLLSDLDKQLQFGPMGAKPPAKKEESEAPAEKGPLSDARKGRARGPARRKPAVTTLPKTETLSPKPEAPEIKITSSWNVWQINEDGAVVVGDDKVVEKSSTSEPSSPPESSINNTATDTVEHAVPKAAEVKDECSDKSPADNVVSDEVKDEPSTDEVPKAISPESGSTPSHDEKLPSPDEPSNKSDGDEEKKEEEQPEPEPDDTVEPGNKSPTVPTTTSGEDQDPEDSAITDKERKRELETTPVDEEKKSSNEAINSDA